MTLPSPADDDPRPVEPQPPNLEDCCGNGCDPCIFDLYDAERERYRVALREWEARQSQRRGGGSD